MVARLACFIKCSLGRTVSPRLSVAVAISGKIAKVEVSAGNC